MIAKLSLNQTPNFFKVLYIFLPEKNLLYLKNDLKKNLIKDLFDILNLLAGTLVSFVPKHRGEYRLIIDYIKLNKCTIRDSYLLYNVMLESLNKSNLFSKFDLSSA